MILLAALSSAATLSGRVLDAQGSPVAGLTVVAYDARLNYATATTTSAGEWSIIRLPGRAYRLRAYAGESSVWVDRFYPSEVDFCSGEIVTVGEDEVRDGLDLVVQRGGRLSGQVLDAEGEPLVGAEIRAEGTTERTALAARVGVSGADGTFVVEGLDSDPGVPETYRCALATEGWPDQYLGPTYAEEEAAGFEVTLGGDAEAGVWRALDGISVGGTVYGPDGPVGSGTVFVYASSQVLATSIGADGTYVGDGLPPGDVITWAESDGLATTYYPDGDRPGDRVPVPDEGAYQGGLDLHLPAENTLTLHFSGEGDLSEVGVMLYNSELTVGRGGGLDNAGTIRIGALHEADYTLFVYGADGGFVDDWVGGAAAPRVFHVAGDMVEDLPLTRSASIRGTVTDETGAPVYGAYVYVFPADGSDTQAVATEDDGTYEVRGLGGGDVILRTSYVNYCPDDPGYVLEYWEDAWLEDDADFLSVPAGEALDGVDVQLWIDADHDAMGDTWEGENGLDPTRDDAAEDPDGDGFTNYDEWILGSDPTDATSGKPGACGCGSAAAGWLLPGLLVAARRRRSGARRAG